MLVLRVRPILQLLQLVLVSIVMQPTDDAVSLVADLHSGMAGLLKIVVILDFFFLVSPTWIQENYGDHWLQTASKLLEQGLNCA